MKGDWLTADRAELASSRILDIAGELFEAQGVGRVTMSDIAASAGCSRPTLYRYFAGRDELLAAYVDRAARALGRSIAQSVADLDDPTQQLLTAIVTALSGVRADPALAVWFTRDTAGQSSGLALISPVIEALSVDFLTGLLPDATTADRSRCAHWLVRVIVSLLTDPGTSPDDELELLRRFVIPVITPA